MATDPATCPTSRRDQQCARATSSPSPATSASARPSSRTRLSAELGWARLLRAGHPEPLPRRLLRRHAALELPPPDLLPERALQGPGRRSAASPLPFIQDRTIYEDAEIFARTLHEQGSMTEVDYENYTALFHVLVGVPAQARPDPLPQGQPRGADGAHRAARPAERAEHRRSTTSRGSTAPTTTGCGARAPRSRCSRSTPTACRSRARPRRSGELVDDLKRRYPRQAELRARPEPRPRRRRPASARMRRARRGSGRTAAPVARRHVGAVGPAAVALRAGRRARDLDRELLARRAAPPQLGARRRAGTPPARPGSGARRAIDRRRPGERHLGLGGGGERPWPRAAARSPRSPRRASPSRNAHSSSPRRRGRRALRPARRGGRSRPRRAGPGGAATPPRR